MDDCIDQHTQTNRSYGLYPGSLHPHHSHGENHHDASGMPKSQSQPADDCYPNPHR